jgi:hypothetical protein
MDHLLRPSTEQEARAFVDKVALPALTALSQEFAARGITSGSKRGWADRCHLLVPQQSPGLLLLRIEARPAPAFNPLRRPTTTIPRPASSSPSPILPMAAPVRHPVPDPGRAECRRLAPVRALSGAEPGRGGRI